VGLFAFIFFYQRHVGGSSGEPIRVLPNLKAAAVTSMQVRSGTRAPIRADRTNGVWQLAEPVVYPAQAASIEKLLAEIQRLTPAPYISARELRDRPKVDETYGFSNPQASILIEQPEHPAHLLVGATTPPTSCGGWFTHCRPVRTAPRLSNRCTCCRASESASS
jgi:hypothetical protein